MGEVGASAQTKFGKKWSSLFTKLASATCTRYLLSALLVATVDKSSFFDRSMCKWAGQTSKEWIPAFACGHVELGKNWSSDFCESAMLTGTPWLTPYSEKSSLQWVADTSCWPQTDATVLLLSARITKNAFSFTVCAALGAKELTKEKESADDKNGKDGDDAVTDKQYEEDKAIEATADVTVATMKCAAR